MTSLVLPPGRVRSRGIDATRGVALLSMYVAHFSTGVGVLKALEVTEFLTAALFATLIGVGAELAHASPRRDEVRDLVSALVRGAVLVLVGLWLEGVGAQIYVVLVWLGVLTVLAHLLVRLPTVLVVAVTAAAFVAGPLIRADLTETYVPRSWLTELTFTHPSYWLVGFLVHAATGVLALRAVRRPAIRRVVVPWGAIAAIAVAVVLLALMTLDRVDIAAYSGTHAELFLTTCLCLGTLAVVVGVVDALPPAATAPLVWLGQMALTLYAAHVLFAAWVVQHRLTDNGVDVMLATILGSLVAVALWRGAWRLVLGDGSTTAWVRGPAEGVVALLVALLIRPLAGVRGRMGRSVRRPPESPSGGPPGSPPESTA